MVTTFPFAQDLVFLRDAMHQLLDESFIPSGGSRWYGESISRTQPMTRPIPLDVYATQDEVIVLAAVPGMNPRDLEITYNQNTVTLAGSVPSAAESEQGKQATWYARELWHGQFRRSLTLPYEVDVQKAEATFENGIVRLVLPRAEWTKPQKIAITAGGQHQQAIASGSPQGTAS